MTAPSTPSTAFEPAVPSEQASRPAADGLALVRLQQEPEIVLTWLVRLRWLAAAGQILATTAAYGIFELGIAVTPIACVIAVTIASNLGLVQLMRSGLTRGRAWLVPGVIVLDVLLLTALLYFSGGAQNPFSILYIVHVVMAVVVLGAGWTWLIAALASVCFGLLLFYHRPAAERVPSPMVASLGQWLAFALVAALIGYFVGRVAGALRRREQELSAAREQAARSEQLASLSTLAAGAAHELGTPLGTIAVVAKELELASAHDQLVNDDAKLIRQEVDRCRAILDRMRVDMIDGLHQTVTVAPLEDLIDRLRSGLPEDERKRLRVRSVQPLKFVTGPVRAIEQAVHVLLRNAFDATPASDQPVTLDIRRHEGSTMFSVEDRGAGMPQDVLKRAGRPFFTTKAPGKGMGLGLFLVRLVAERYGGKFELTSTVGVGTKSTLVIPETVDDAHAGETVN
ncbi:MAG: two-component system, sensor histidine kinase RegB [Phycisphaerales bacterium]|jgi:two-component system sensor histidine kinase RegB|nr:two-component system, sensor histidine kinase RegB [Phycisphaerales bacterium]